MKKFALAAVAALTLSLGFGSAFAAPLHNDTNNAPQSYVYTPGGG